VRLSRLNEQLIQDKAQLQRQLDERAENIPRLQTLLRQTEEELTRTRQSLLDTKARGSRQLQLTRRRLDSVRQQLSQKETVLKDQSSAAALEIRDAAESSRQLDVQKLANQLLQREKGQLTQKNALLQQQVQDLMAELANAQSKIAAANQPDDRHVAVKQEKLDAVADAYGAARQAAKATDGKRKAESELKSEAKRRRHVEGKLAALVEQLDEKDKCIICLDKQPDVLFSPCNHLVCCSVCAKSLVRGAAAGATCPKCMQPLRANDIIKVFRA
jgi:hypothetical protein